MTSRSRQPDRKRLAGIADGSHRRRVELHVELPAVPAPARSHRTCAFRGAGKESAVAGAGRRSESLPQGRIRIWSATGAVLLAMAATGCSDNGGALSGTTTTALPRSTTTTAAERTVEEEVTDQYLAFWEARREANSEPVNPDHPGLREHAADDQLEQVVLETSQRRDQGLAIRPADDAVSEHRVKVVAVDGDTATVQDCMTDDDVVYRVATGEVVNDDVATRNIEATMRQIEGVWKLVHTRVVQTWEGVVGCAQSPDF